MVTMLEPALRTIPHTGTQFTQKLLRDVFGIDNGHQHVDDRSDEWVAERMVFTLRDPMLSVLSHLNRGNDLRPELWSVYTERAQGPDVHVFRVDVPHQYRMDELMLLQDFVGLPMKCTPDWEPVNAKGDPKGLKAAYSKGTIPDQARPAFDVLKATPGLGLLLVNGGYDLFWMDDLELGAWDI